MKYLLIIFCFAIQSSLFSQGHVSNFNEINPIIAYDNIHVKKLSSDINSTTFAIWIKQRVKMHKHLNHIENIYVTQGSGSFYLADSIINIKSGDLIVVPNNTWHGVDVTSKTPLKVLSIQSPEFIGNDRVFKEE
jgi:mannose-6-phosphate isomerase-like protein (cupin superfamily)